MASGGATSAATLFNNEPMTAAETTPAAVPGATPKLKDSIGPELGIGFALGNYTADPVMCLKSCIAWEASIQYDGDTHRASGVLSNLTTYYPGAAGYEVAGFFWWQGSKDAYDMALADHYEENLVALIKALRLLYKAPKAPFVSATLGQTQQNDTTTTDGVILHALEAVDGTGKFGAVKYPDFKGNVATVYAHPLSEGSTSENHYDGNAETYMNIGEAMGQAMVGMLKGARQAS